MLTLVGFYSLSMFDFGKYLIVRFDWRFFCFVFSDWGIAVAWGVSLGVLLLRFYTVLGGFVFRWIGVVVWVVCGMFDFKFFIFTLFFCVFRFFCLKYFVIGKDDIFILVWLCWLVLFFLWKDIVDSLKGLGIKG